MNVHSFIHTFSVPIPSFSPASSSRTISLVPFVFGRRMKNSRTPAGEGIKDAVDSFKPVKDRNWKC